VESDHNVLMKSLGAILQCDELKPRLKLIIHQPSLDVYRQSGSPFIDILDKLHLGPRLQAMMRENCMINLPHILRSPGINKLFDAFTGVPALLVSAGPSLSYDLPLLNDAPRNRLLFSVTTIFNLLLSGGVRPDLAFIGDPKKIMETHFENRIAREPGRTFINVSRTGARINGTLEMPLCEVMSRYAAMPVDKSPLSNLFR